MNKDDLLEFGKILREDGILKYRDLYVLTILMKELNFDTYVDFRNKTFCKKARMDKSSFSKSKKSLLESKLIIEKEDAGFKLNNDRHSMEMYIKESYTTDDNDYYME